MKNKKFLRMLLALCIVAIMVPMFVLTANAAEQTTPDYQAGCREELVPSSYYPSYTYYGDYEDNTQYFTWPGASYLEITFSTNTNVETNYDWIYIYNGAGQEISRWTGTELAGVTMTIAGDSFSIRLTSDSSVNRYGYSISSIFADGAHSFGNSCYGTCSYCGEQASHEFDTWYDMRCNKCGTTRSISAGYGWQKLDGKWYYGQGSSWKTGWFKSGAYWYYFNADGQMATGWFKCGNTWYYANSSGAMQTGWQKISGKWYLFTSDGAMRTGWVQSGSSWYYLKPGSGEMATGLVTIGGTNYFFNSSGIWQPAGMSGWVSSNGQWYYFVNSNPTRGWKQISGKWYYFNASGVMQSRTWIQSGNKWCYLTSGGNMATTWCMIDGSYYYFDSNGFMQTGWKQISGKWYYLGTDGIMWTGWYYDEAGDYWYMFRNDGSMVTGWYKSPYCNYYDELEGGDYYYFDNQGRQLFGEQTIGGKTYYFDEDWDGVMRRDTWYRVGSYYYGYDYYFFGSDGAMVKSQWKRIDGYDYYFDAYGECDRTPIGVTWY